MPTEAPISDSVDPLSGLNGPSLFPRTIRVPLPADAKDLDPIHNLMKSLEIRSPEKLMNEAKRIVDGGAEFVESNLLSYAKNVLIPDGIAAKGKDRPQERRQGLGLSRKRAPFSLKASVSQPSANLEPTLNIDQLQDPDEFFDAYERMENAKKEIQKQQGGSTDNLNLNKPSNNARRRRPGILGKLYSYKHRYSSAPPENDSMFMESHETTDQEIPSETKDKSQEKLVHPDLNPNSDTEEVEVAESTKKIYNEVSDILEELLSYNDEDLEGPGALNLLQERLKIKPLDQGNLYMTELPADVGRTSISIVSRSFEKSHPHRSSLLIDSALRNLKGKTPTKPESVANPVNHVSSPTPPRSPFASISVLKKKILQSNPFRDPFSPLDANISACGNASPAQSNDKLLGQVYEPRDLEMSIELESRDKVDISEPTISNTDMQDVMENQGGLPEQFVDENASAEETNSYGRSINESENNIGETMLFVDENASAERENSYDRPNEESENNIGKALNIDENKSNPSEPEEEPRDVVSNRQQADSEQEPEVHRAKVSRKRVAVTDKLTPSELEEEPRDATSNRQQADSEQEPEVHHAKLSRKRVADGKRIRKAHLMRKSLAVTDKSTPSELEEEPRDATSNRQQADSEQEPEVHHAKLSRKRVAGGERIRKAHPMRKSLAESGTTFDTGVRRSKRIKMRPLEYWKGERFLYGRVDDSLKLVGVKYFSPGNANDGLKVKPYISSEYKEVLEMAALH